MEKFRYTFDKKFNIKTNVNKITARKQDECFESNQFLTLGCVLKGIMDTFAAEIQTFNNSDIETCATLCNNEVECDQWTQIHGVCYLKTEDSFKHYRKHLNKKWISGIRNCKSNGMKK